MEVEDSEFQVLVISIAVCVSLEGFDFTIGSFQFCGTDAMFVPIEQERFPHLQLFGSIVEDLDAADMGFVDPVQCKYRAGARSFGNNRLALICSSENSAASV